MKGTGKTRTIVAAIVEIVRTSNNSVLVCANSNAACDEITERLVKILRTDEIFRMYAKSIRTEPSESIKPVSNHIAGEYKFPSLEYLYKFRVVICTLHTAGCISQARFFNENQEKGKEQAERGVDKIFNSSHFSHVFIDEAASVQMSVALIPIAGTCFLKINT